jgi:hypothetical protein
MQAASTTNQSDIRGLVRRRRTRADRETFRREPGVLRTRVRRPRPPVALCASPMALIVPAPQGRLDILNKELSAFLPLGPGCAFQSPPVSRKAINAIFRLSCVPRIRCLLPPVQGEGLWVCDGTCRSIAHTKPASSRTTAIIATGAALPRSVRCRYRRYRRFAARSAKSTAHAG